MGARHAQPGRRREPELAAGRLREVPKRVSGYKGRWLLRTRNSLPAIKLAVV